MTCAGPVLTFATPAAVSNRPSSCWTFVDTNDENYLRFDQESQSRSNDGLGL